MSPALRSIAVVIFGLLAVWSSNTARAADEELDRLHTVLKSDAPLHEKAVACKRLAVIGTRDSVPILAALLSDPTLSHYARFGLEANPDASVDEALRQALTSLQGKQLIGVINSIGQRRDGQAIEALRKLLAQGDPQTAAAAAAAMGRIADEHAVRTLLQRLNEALPDQPIIADACLTAADLMHAHGQKDAALTVYRAVRDSKAPKHTRLAATLSAVRIQGTSSLELFNQLLQSDDNESFAVALQASRALSGEGVTRTLIGQLDRQAPERQALLLTALADQGGKAARSALQQRVTSDAPNVRLAAIGGLGKAGDSSAVELLMAAATSADEPTAAAARAALEVLPGQDVDEAILAQQNPDDPQRIETVVRLAGVRRINSAMPLLLQAVRSPQELLRLAAIQALGELGGTEELGILAERALAAQSPDEEAAAKAALIAAAVRTADRDACADELAALFAAGVPARRVVVFDILRELGGDRSLALVVAAAHERDDAVQDAATQALGEWLTEDVAAPLLEMTESATSQKYKVRALRGYIRVIRQFGLPVDQRAEMSRHALRLAERDDERKLVLEALTRFPSPQALTIAVEQLSNPALRGPAAQAALVISQQLTAESDRVAVREALRKVVDAQINGEITARANAFLKRVAD